MLYEVEALIHKEKVANFWKKYWAEQKITGQVYSIG